MLRGNGTVEKKRLPAGLFASVYVRSLTLQASWNPQRMQNLGLLTVLLPWMQGRTAAITDRRLFCRRYYGFFNTNPYLANFIVGGLLHLEEQAAPPDAAAAQSTQLTTTFRDSLGRAFASLGDQLVWLGIKPVLVLLACLLACYGQMWAVLLVFLLFALAQFELRRRALLAGYELGLDIVEVLSHAAWHRVIKGAKVAGMILTGTMAGFYFARLHRLDNGLDGFILLGCVVLGVGLPLLLRRRSPGEGIVPLALLLAFGLTFLL